LSGVSRVTSIITLACLGRGSVMPRPSATPSQRRVAAITAEVNGQPCERT
jgi:hypothetical protein